MARQAQTAEFNTFVQGLITEASALNFPENASLSEENFVLRRDGSRDRRLGMDYESGYELVDSGVNLDTEEELAVSTFSWKNAGGFPEKTLVVVQTGAVVKVFDSDVSPLSSGEVGSLTLTGTAVSQVFSYAVVDGTLVIATGAKSLQVLEWDGSSISSSERNLTIRDQFGVEDLFNGRDLNEGTGLTVRPTSLTDNHLYNLRNQTWALPKETGKSSTDKGDTVDLFKQQSGLFPSNADNVNFAVYADPNDEDNRTGDQFFPRDLENNPPGSFPAPRGFFVIDALERGQSRLNQAQLLESDNPVLSYSVANLPTDKTPGGPRCIEEYAGRIWYAGFSGEVIDGDARSPRLSSYVFYSQLVQGPSNIAKCYQDGDPTSRENPDLLDTDGGFIRVDGAYNIQALVNVGSAIMVVAENGIWMISGGSGYGFTANNNMRRKLSDNGGQSPGSVVVVDNSFYFWADDAIYQVATDQFGDWNVQNMTSSTIQSFYDQILPVDKLYAQGGYDSYDRKIRWVYQNRLNDNGDVKELIFDVTLGAFYTSSIKSLPGGVFPRVSSPFEVPPFRLNEIETDVVYNGETVTYEGEVVAENISIRGAGTREIFYLTVTNLNPITYTFSSYRDSSFLDWVSEDGVGVDADAFLVTGYLSGGDHLRYKQAPYIQFFFTRTEDGFFDDGSGNLFPTNESSCFVQTQWEWANSANSNRWGRPFQAYRYKRLYSPQNASDPFDSGFEVITTKNKLRGKGKVLSLKIYTEAGKDCRLLGWAMLLGVNGNV